MQVRLKPLVSVLIPQTPKGVEHLRTVRGLARVRVLVLIPQTPKGVEHCRVILQKRSKRAGANSSDAQRR